MITLTLTLTLNGHNSILTRAIRQLFLSTAWTLTRAYVFACMFLRLFVHTTQVIHPVTLDVWFGSYDKHLYCLSRRKYCPCRSTISPAPFDAHVTAALLEPHALLSSRSPSPLTCTLTFACLHSSKHASIHTPLVAHMHGVDMDI